MLLYAEHEQLERRKRILCLFESIALRRVMNERVSDRAVRHLVRQRQTVWLRARPNDERARLFAVQNILGFRSCTIEVPRHLL